MGNAPSGVLNVLIAGGGTQIYDVVNIVGGMQKPLVENNLIEPIDTARMPNWGKDTYIREFLAPGKPGFDFIGYKGNVYGVPTVLQGDSFAYLPEKTGPLDSYGALFDPKWKGYVALEDNFTTTGQKTALYLQKSRLASIKDPANMTPAEIKTVIDFLIAKKKAGQFRVIWSSFEQSVNLLTSREVYVMDCWEPMVFVAKKKGVSAVYAAPKEGYLLWAMAAYIVRNPKRSKEQEKAAYELLDFMLGGWYGAKITLSRGYMTNPAAVAYAKSNPGEFGPAEAQEIAAIDANVRKKFQSGVTLLGLLLAYPIAYFLALRVRRDLARNVLLLFTIPFLVNYIIRTFSWVYLLSRTGPVNRALMAAGVTQRAVDWLLFSDFAVFVGLISSYMPFMIYPLWAALDGLDRRLVEASWLLGASPRVTFLRVTLPLSMPGVFAAVIFGFVGTFGESAVPIILGGVGYQLMGNTITSALDVLNYPLAAAMSSVVVATMLAFLLVWYLAFDLRAVLGKIARWRF